MTSATPRQAETGCSDFEQEWVAELRRIAALDEPEWRKMLYRDSLNSTIARVAWAAGERAAEARARAVTSGDDEAAARRESINEELERDQRRADAVRRTVQTVQAADAAALGTGRPSAEKGLKDPPSGGESPTPPHRP